MWLRILILRTVYKAWCYAWFGCWHTLCPLRNFYFFCCLLIFFKINFFEKFFQEYQLGVKQIGSRSCPTLCRAWSLSNLFAKVEGKRVERFLLYLKVIFLPFFYILGNEIYYMYQPGNWARIMMIFYVNFISCCEIFSASVMFCIWPKLMNTFLNNTDQILQGYFSISGCALGKMD